MIKICISQENSIERARGHVNDSFRVAWCSLLTYPCMKLQFRLSPLQSSALLDKSKIQGKNSCNCECAEPRPLPFRLNHSEQETSKLHRRTKTVAPIISGSTNPAIETAKNHQCTVKWYAYAGPFDATDTLPYFRFSSVSISMWLSKKKQEFLKFFCP